MDKRGYEILNAEEVEGLKKVSAVWGRYRIAQSFKTPSTGKETSASHGSIE